MLGEFVAVEDPVAGKKILEYTEAGALAREPKQPVLPPADPPKDATSNAAG